jgi:amino acid transporter
VIPIVAFGFIGLEAISVTAFEAAPKSLAWPSRFVAYIASSMYLLCLLSQCLNIPWTNPDLPEIYGGIGKIQKRDDDGGSDASFSNILAIMAIRKWGKNNLDGFINGAIIFSVLSASNTALYISSRTLYGMALRIQDSSVLGKAAKAFKRVDHKTGVPLRALVLSWASFIWVPFLSLGNNDRLQIQYVGSSLLTELRANLFRSSKSSSSRQALAVWSCGHRFVWRT